MLQEDEMMRGRKMGRERKGRGERGQREGGCEWQSTGGGQGWLSPAEQGPAGTVILVFLRHRLF